MDNHAELPRNRRDSHVRLMDTPGFNKVAMKRPIRAREHALYRELDVAPDPNSGDAGYYTLLDLLGEGFAEWLLKTVLPPPVDTTALSCHRKSVRRARRRCPILRNADLLGP
ncbi:MULTISPECIES: hypothetical protein [Sphingobium]|uniref:hypothetical protein n=1 Tax=Sphingobium TaxID=165695 RepID=UPI000301923B|nr:MULTISPECIES: hypothetical protein [Sphingobium]WQE08834.1 hypothetical protein U0025_08155 [Sphingobium yanoikuyae]